MKKQAQNRETEFLTGFFFTTGSITLTDLSKPALYTVENYIKENPAQSFYIVGHTGDTGILQSNITLSRDRENSVVTALQSYGIETSRLSAQGVGPYSPASNNSSKNGRELNRGSRAGIKSSLNLLRGGYCV